MKYWIRYCIFVFLVTSFTACNKDDGGKIPPLSVPFSIAKAGNQIDFYMIIKEKKIYAFDIVYMYKKGDKAERDNLWRLAGGEYRDKSGRRRDAEFSLTFNIELSQVENGLIRKVMQKKIINPRLSSWAAGILCANMVDVELEPGHYKVHLENLQNSPQFQRVKTELAVAPAYLGK